MPSPFPNSIAIRWDHSKKRFVEQNCRDLTWSVHDSGALYGAILVERFRSYGQRFLSLSDHRARLELGAQSLGIDLSALPFDLQECSERLLSLNESLVKEQSDVSIVVLLSPGEASADGNVGTMPTLMLHLSPLPFVKLHRWYTQGVDLVCGPHQIVPSACWPNQIKTRSRLPYFLSDLERPDRNDLVLPVLKTASGSVADTSVANVLIVSEQGLICSPRKEDILVGCTLLSLERLLAKENTSIIYRDISSEMLRNAREIILTGSSGGVWFARSVDGKEVGENDRTISTRLIELWKQYVGIDYMAQAAKLTERTQCVSLPLAPIRGEGAGGGGENCQL